MVIVVRSPLSVFVTRIKWIIPASVVHAAIQIIRDARRMIFCFSGNGGTNLVSARDSAIAQAGAYFAPNKTVRELHELMKSGTGIDPLKDFSEAARDELRAFTSL